MHLETPKAEPCGIEVSAILRSDATCFQMLSCLSHNGAETLPAGVQNSTGPYQHPRQQSNLKARRADQSYLAHPPTVKAFFEV